MLTKKDLIERAYSIIDYAPRDYSAIAHLVGDCIDFGYSEALKSKRAEEIIGTPVYRKPTSIRAWEVTSDNLEALAELCHGHTLRHSTYPNSLAVPSNEGTQHADYGDYLIREEDDYSIRFYVITGDVFDRLFSLQKPIQELTDVTRIEVITPRGREYQNSFVKEYSMALQDENRTLKIFIDMEMNNDI